MNVKGKVAIITGASRGMGANHAKRFVAAGAKVVITDLHEEGGKALAEELAPNAIFVKQDVTCEQDWIRVMNSAVKAFGRIDILINNAGSGVFKPIEEMEVDEFMFTMKVNALSTFLGVKYAAKYMKSSGGSIVNISSVDGIRGDYAGGAYSASKFAVNSITRTAALELGPYGIRVNSVLPGAVDTGAAEDVTEEYSEMDTTKNIPLHRYASMDEISNIVMFLAGEESSYITGAEYLVDGGFTSCNVW